MRMKNILLATICALTATVLQARPFSALCHWRTQGTSSLSKDCTPIRKSGRKRNPIFRLHAYPHAFPHIPCIAGLPRSRPRVLGTEKVISELIIDVHSLGGPGLFLLFRCLPVIQVLRIHIGAIHIQKSPDRTGEVQPVVVLHERDDITAPSTAETLVTVQGGIEHERGSLLLMEHASAHLAVRPG